MRTSSLGRETRLKNHTMSMGTKCEEPIESKSILTKIRVFVNETVSLVSTTLKNTTHGTMLTLVLTTAEIAKFFVCALCEYDTMDIR
jgi:hypothetical protein